MVIIISWWSFKPGIIHHQSSSDEENSLFKCGSRWELSVEVVHVSECGLNATSGFFVDSVQILSSWALLSDGILSLTWSQICQREVDLLARLAWALEEEPKLAAATSDGENVGTSDIHNLEGSVTTLPWDSDCTNQCPERTLIFVIFTSILHSLNSSLLHGLDIGDIDLHDRSVTA